MKNLSVWPAVLLLTLSMGGCETNVEPCDFECNFECVDPLTDPLNCGGCGVVCPAGTTCENASCQCPGTNELCEGECLDVLSNPHNCGGCGVLCTYDSQCTVGECGEYLEPYGTLSVSFSTAFIFDGARFFGDATYQSDHWAAGFSEAATCTGTYGSALSIPGPGPAAANTLSYAQRFVADANSGDHLEIEQRSYLDSSYAIENAANPNVRIVFPGDDLQVQDYDVDADDLAESVSPWIYVFNQVTDLSICVLAVASGGTLSVTAAESTTSLDGGGLTLQATELLLYHPTATPYGDITPDILSMGILVCDME
jgi:hypothetical protein